MDQYGNSLPENGISILTFSGLGSQGDNNPSINNAPFESGIEVSFNSQGTATVTLITYKAEPGTLTVADGTERNLGPGLEVAVAPGAATTLVFDNESSHSVYGTAFALTVRTQDYYGNLSNIGLPDTLPVSQSIASGEGSVVGDTDLNIGTSDGNGIISFKNLQVTAAGDYELIAGAEGLLAGSVHVNIEALVVAATIQVANKTYDGTAAATLANFLVIGALPQDEVALMIEGSANFSDKNVGVGKTASVSGLKLTGMAARSYILSQTSVVGITKRLRTVSV